MDQNAIGYLQRALRLARRGTALASPNPLVGCVLVREGQIVGEGQHSDLLQTCETYANLYERQLVAPQGRVVDGIAAELS